MFSRNSQGFVLEGHRRGCLLRQILDQRVITKKHSRAGAHTRLRGKPDNESEKGRRLRRRRQRLVSMEPSFLPLFGVVAFSTFPPPFRSVFLHAKSPSILASLFSAVFRTSPRYNYRLLEIIGQ